MAIREIMREIMIEIFDNIEWAVVAVAMLASVGCILVVVAFCTAIVYENVLLLLLLFPAVTCISLSIGIYTGCY